MEKNILKIHGKIKREKLSVRAVEKLVKDKIDRKRSQVSTKKKVPTEVLALENEIVALLGTKVKLKPSKDGGTIIVHYFSDEDLERIIDMFRSID